VAMGMASSGWSRHSWMVYRDRLGNVRVRSMALWLVDRETLASLHRCAKDHAPQGEVDFNSDPYLRRPHV
jgi:hypothetical protein